MTFHLNNGETQTLGEFLQNLGAVFLIAFVSIFLAVVFIKGSVWLILNTSVLFSIPIVAGAVLTMIIAATVVDEVDVEQND